MIKFIAFLIVMPHTQREDAVRIIEKIRTNIQTINLKHEYSDVSDRITLSLGATVINTKDKDYKAYIKDADKALYISKENGRNTYTFFN